MDKDPIQDMIDALVKYQQSNREPAVAEPANDFEKAVNKWHELQMLQTTVKDALKPVNEDEKEQRDALAAGLVAFLGADLKEGNNDYKLSNKRKLKLGYKVERKIDETQVVLTREEYQKAAKPGDAPFEDLLRVKYDLAIAPWRKLSAEGTKAFSKAVVTKVASPTLAVD